LTITFVLFAVDTTSAIEPIITKLQGQFRKLGGTVVPIEGKLGSDYRSIACGAKVVALSISRREAYARRQQKRVNHKRGIRAAKEI